MASKSRVQNLRFCVRNPILELNCTESQKHRIKKEKITILLQQLNSTGAEFDWNAEVNPTQEEPIENLRKNELLVINEMIVKIMFWHSSTYAINEYFFQNAKYCTLCTYDCGLDLTKYTQPCGDKVHLYAYMHTCWYCTAASIFGTVFINLTVWRCYSINKNCKCQWHFKN